jgi:branched-chain amino acid transport system permease protein
VQLETSVDVLSWVVSAGSVVGFLDSYWPFIIPGLVSGAIYALLGTGLVLTYRTTGVLNLAFGAQAYVSAVVYYELRVGAEWPSVPAVLVAVVGVAPVLGYVLERMVFRYLRGQPMLIKIGVSIGMLVAIPRRGPDASRL